MYFNVFGEKVSKARYREMVNAAKNRRELIAAGLNSRRDLLKMGLLGAGGMLVAKSGLSARAGQQVQTNNPPSSGNNTSPGTNQNCVPGNQTASPPTRPFIQALPIMPLAQRVSSLTPTPTENPNLGAGEVRAAPFQAPLIDASRFPLVPATLYKMNQRQFATRQHPDLPVQTIWGFDDGTGTRSPGPTYQAFYGRPQLTRNINSLPSITEKNNTGFGMASVSTHLHNAHNPSESDGNPCDFYTAGHFCDQYYPNVLAGFNSTNEPNGDINESLSTLWYHDHRVDFTSQNTYKGLAGFYCLFNQFDTGDSSTGFHLPDFPEFDIPLLFADRVYDPGTGELVFDLFNLDGILGDKFLVNGKIQPFFQVEPRRYRFRLLDTGPSRFYEFFLTNLANLNQAIPYWLIGTDGNLIPHPIQIQSVRIGPAERVDVIIDFTKLAGQTIYLENRLNQVNGQGPVGVDSQFFPQNGTDTECSQLGVPVTAPNGTQNTNAVLNAGQGNLVLQFLVTGPHVPDNSVNPATKPTYYQLPSTKVEPRIVRTFKFDRLNGQWSINGQFFDCGYGNDGTGG